MNADRRPSVSVLDLRIDVHVVCVRTQRRRLDRETDRRRVITLDVAFEFSADAFKPAKVPWELRAASARVNRIAADKAFLMRVLQVLPAWHPGNRAAGDIVGKTRLTEQLRQISICRSPVKVVA